MYHKSEYEYHCKRPSDPWTNWESDSYVIRTHVSGNGLLTFNFMPIIFKLLLSMNKRGIYKNVPEWNIICFELINYKANFMAKGWTLFHQELLFTVWTSAELFERIEHLLSQNGLMGVPALSTWLRNCRFLGFWLRRNKANMLTIVKKDKLTKPKNIAFWGMKLSFLWKIWASSQFQPNHKEISNVLQKQWQLGSVPVLNWNFSVNLTDVGKW